MHVSTFFMLALAANFGCFFVSGLHNQLNRVIPRTVPQVHVRPVSSPVHLVPHTPLPGQVRVSQVSSPHHSPINHFSNRPVVAPRPVVPIAPRIVPTSPVRHPAHLVGRPVIVRNQFHAPRPVAVVRTPVIPRPRPTSHFTPVLIRPVAPTHLRRPLVHLPSAVPTVHQQRSQPPVPTRHFIVQPPVQTFSNVKSSRLVQHRAPIPVPTPRFIQQRRIPVPVVRTPVVHNTRVSRLQPRLVKPVSRVSSLHRPATHQLPTSVNTFGGHRVVLPSSPRVPSPVIHRTVNTHVLPRVPSISTHPISRTPVAFTRTVLRPAPTPIRSHIRPTSHFRPAAGHRILRVPVTPVHSVPAPVRPVAPRSQSVLTLPRQQSAGHALPSTHTLSVSHAWGTWGRWSACSATCGQGLQTRTRACHARSPLSHGGVLSGCQGSSVERIFCQIRCCAVAGNWSLWSHWTNYGGNHQYLHRRTRTCTNPPPSCGGQYCIGSATDIQYIWG